MVLSPETLIARLPLAASRDTLEIGTGSGFYGTAIGEHSSGARVVLLDLQPEMLARCRQRNAQLGVATTLAVAADAMLLPFGDGAFDLIYLVTVFGEVPDPAALLLEAHRVLRPNGILSISEHLPDPDFVPLSTLRRLAEPVGFVLQRRFGNRFAFTANFVRGD